MEPLFTDGSMYKIDTWHIQEELIKCIVAIEEENINLPEKYKRLTALVTVVKEQIRNIEKLEIKIDKIVENSINKRITMLCEYSEKFKQVYNEEFPPLLEDRFD